MAAVPQKTLNWLYSVLGREYRDRNRAYSDIAQTLSQYNGFAPRTDVYTYENGAPALLVLLAGTIPVSFHTQMYRFPITLWIPHAYPYEAPIVYVTPTEDMVVRPGQHVGGDGRVYHHYLALWRDAWDRSNITDMLSILSGVFAKEPPVVSKQQVMDQIPLQQHSAGSAPPVPPMPPELQRPPPASSNRRSSQQPPPPPPKQPSGERPTSASPEPQRPGRYNVPPPLPTQIRTASFVRDRPQSSQANGSPSDSTGGLQYLPQRHSSLRQSMLAQGPPPQAHPMYEQQSNQSPQPQQPPQPQLTSTNQAWQYQAPVPHLYDQHPTQQPQTPRFSGSYTVDSQQMQRFAHAQNQSALPPGSQSHKPPRNTQPVNLLDSPFDISLPVASNLPAPPVPRNPEKEALLSALSSALTQTLHNSIAQNDSALPALYAQHAALANTYHKLQSELSHLTALSSTLSSNNTILQSSLQHANTSIASAKERSQRGDIPKVDEMLTAPTVVGKQLYDVVCEERGVEAGMWALQEGFVQGRIGSEIWAKRTRELAREGFRKRVLARKIGRGMGLEGA